MNRYGCSIITICSSTIHTLGAKIISKGLRQLI